jgi:hypothetical protein
MHSVFSPSPTVFAMMNYLVLDSFFKAEQELEKYQQRERVNDTPASINQGNKIFRWRG